MTDKVRDGTDKVDLFDFLVIDEPRDRRYLAGKDFFGRDGAPLGRAARAAHVYPADRVRACEREAGRCQHNRAPRAARVPVAVPADEPVEMEADDGAAPAAADEDELETVTITSADLEHNTFLRPAPSAVSKRAGA
jgi:hypothetical protein